MTDQNLRGRTALALATTGALGLTGYLGWYLPKPGFSTPRLVSFALLAGIAWLGAVGVLRGRSGVAVACAAGLALLGVWQAVLWVGVLPAAGALVVAALLAPDESEGDRSTAAAVDSG